MSKDETISLREYIDIRIHSLEKAIDATSFQMERRLKGMNELREQVNEERGFYMGRQEYDAKHQAVVDKVDNISKIVYMGVGGLFVLEIILKFVLK